MVSLRFYQKEAVSWLEYLSSLQTACTHSPVCSVTWWLPRALDVKSVVRVPHLPLPLQNPDIFPEPFLRALLLPNQLLFDFHCRRDVLCHTQLFSSYFCLVLFSCSSMLHAPNRTLSSSVPKFLYPATITSIPRCLPRFRK